MILLKPTRSTLFAILFVTGYLLSTAGCTQNTQLQDGTDEMAARLDSIAQNVNPKANTYANEVRVSYYEKVNTPQNTTKKIRYHYSFAMELLKAGHTEEAIKRFKTARNLLEGLNPRLQQQFASYKKTVDEFLALSYLRLGEQQNCLMNHSASSCLVPISGEGVHTITEGSEKAIEEYEQILSEREGEQLISRWLLNIAYMTLGKHPEQVPDQWLIPAEAFRSDYEFTRFPEIAMQTGLAERGLSGGSVTEDLNGDGLVDVMASSWGLDDQLHYYENNGDGTFTKATKEAGLSGIVGGLNLRHADFNNDGHADILVLRGAWLRQAGTHPNSLLRNNGDGTFSDVTESTGLLSYHPTQTAEWADFNNDGWLDLYIGNESTKSATHPSELYLSQQDGTFRNVAKEAGVNVTGYIKGTTTGDYNNDGLRDLYVSRLDGPNFLFKNEGPDEDGVPQFTNVAQKAGVREPSVSFPTWFFDYNNDGWLDLFVSSYNATPADMAREFLGRELTKGVPRLYKNNGDGTFTNVAPELGLNKVMYTMGSNFGDINNDGYPDFYVGTGDPDFRSVMPNRMFLNRDGEQFREVTASGGFGHLQKGHGVSFADLDNDGDQDIFTVIGGAYEGDVYMNALFKNPGHNNNWITLEFSGKESNRLGLGNRITVDISTPSGDRSIHTVVTAGGSFGSSVLRQEIGLGNATQINQIEVKWPASRTRQVFKDVKMNQFYMVAEDSDQLKPLERIETPLGTEQPRM